MEMSGRAAISLRTSLSSDLILDMHAEHKGT